ncbi:UNVERIFIED_CONTAM: hypothetical protein K2H54_074907 [Gekko kuhli]
MAGAAVAATATSATPVYCVCREPYDVNRFMIECDICKDWFHGSQSDNDETVQACSHVENILASSKFNPYIMILIQNW